MATAGKRRGRDLQRFGLAPGQRGRQYGDMLVQRILDQARVAPSKIAVVQDGQALSWRDFAALITATRAFLSNHVALAPGVAVICCHRLLDAWVVGMALRSLGLTTIFASDADSLQRLRLGAISCIVTMADEARPGLQQLARTRGLRLLSVPGQALATALPEIAARPDASAILGLGQVPEGGHIMSTSGTTGRHKKVLRSAASEALLLPLHARINGLDGDSLVYAWNFGQWTAGGYRWPLLAWSMGGTVVFHQREDSHWPLAEHAFTHMFATPAMLSDLMDRAGDGLLRRESMRLFITGGEMPRELAARARARLTPRLYNVLASTEALTVAVTLVEGDEDLHWHRIHPEREVQVVGDGGTPLPVGQLGKVRIRILDGLAGYQDDPEATREFFDGEWFYPGDLGVMDGQGRLSLHGRNSDVVNVLGNKVATAGMERLLRERLGAEAVCILGLHPDGGDEQLHVAIESRLQVTDDHCRAALGEELRPLRGVHLHFDLVARLPRNAMGKVQRDELRRMLLSGKRRRLG
jgi:acyl-CoA synthetase (AMP-forming)/AMP-acid ligase II